MKWFLLLGFLALLAKLFWISGPPEVVEPSVAGTVYLAQEIIRADDPSTFLDAAYAGTGQRKMYDRRGSTWRTLDAHLFEARFEDGLRIEAQVNPEFGEDEAAELVDRYLRVIGQLPHVLRVDVKTVWIHKGNQLFGGGNENILIHTGKAAEYERQGILAEVLCHEATHTSLDPHYAEEDAWLRAQQQDGVFISDYAQQNPEREDMAESYLLHLAYRYRRDRIGDQLAEHIERSMAHRMKFFDTLQPDVRPWAR